MPLHHDDAVSDGERRHGRQLLQQSLLRAASSGAGLDANRTRAAGQISQADQASEIGESGKTDAITAATATCTIAVALSSQAPCLIGFASRRVASPGAGASPKPGRARNSESVLDLFCAATRGSGDASVLHHPALDGFAGLAHVLGEQGALLDTREDLFGFLTI